MEVGDPWATAGQHQLAYNLSLIYSVVATSSIIERLRLKIMKTIFDFLSWSHKLWDEDS